MSKFKAFHVKEIGASHIKDGKPCQDFALSSEGDEYALAIVCDGHGGNKYIRSERGSKIAAEKTLNAIIEFMRKKGLKKENENFQKNYQPILTQLATNIIYQWRESISLDFKNEPFSENELSALSAKELNAVQQNDGWVNVYGTTLIAAVRAENFWFGLHIGDGKCVAVSETGEYTQPIPWDDKCFLNVTTSLCDTEALPRFRFYFDTENLPSAIFVGTDGVDDSFGTEEVLHNFYRTVLQLFKEKGTEMAGKELQEYLPTLSAKGSQDDISIAGIIVN